ncbi:MAG: hypothetical protein M3R55_01635 [Acidobacteriota bacterium]|nr:hypothetical protein [Acidobacteriota bacterium]
MQFLRVLLVVLMAVTVAGCGVIGGIFKAGLWVGVILVVLVLLLGGFIASRFRRRG